MSEDTFIAYFANGGSLGATSFESLSDIIAKHYCMMDSGSPQEVISISEFVDGDEIELSQEQIDALNKSVDLKFAEYEQDASNYGDLVREISCPKATGRI